MTVVGKSTHLPQAEQEKKTVALSSILAAVFLTGMKIVVGLATGSLGILAEAAHSGLDLIAAVVTYFAVRLSAKPPDHDHTYGHGKIENISALFETLLLLVTCAWIIYEAIQRLFFTHVDVDTSIWAFIVMGTSIIIDITRSRALLRVAKKYSSQALEADALHFSTDVWSSSVVIVGLFLVSIANFLSLPWLVKADAIAAIVVAGIVIYVSLQLGRKTIFDLLDAIPPGLRDEVSHATRQVPGVQAVERVRIRRSGPEFFTDVEVRVREDLALESAHEIATQVEAAIRSYLPEADVVVHVAPDEPQDSGLIRAIYRTAARQGLRIHSVRLYEIKGAYSLELHLEVDDILSLDMAHTQASALEETLRQEIPGLAEVVTHIEPIGEFSATRQQLPSDDDKILKIIQEALDQLGLCFDPHEVKIRRSAETLSISFHCIMDGETAITEAHALTEQVEGALYASIPNLGRVVIHVEPPQLQDFGKTA